MAGKPKSGKSKKLNLKPSARDNRRYLLIDEENKDKVEDLLLKYLGVLGFAKSAYKYVKKLNGKIVGSCLRRELNNVRAGLFLGGVFIERVSGSLKGLNK